jgi:hypothetical protein
VLLTADFGLVLTAPIDLTGLGVALGVVLGHEFE